MANYPETTTTAFTDDIILTNGGKVGIGTTSPGDILDIRSTETLYPALRARHTDNNGQVFLGVAGTQIQVYAGTAHGILVDGTVGIGTTDPAYDLDVDGDVQVDGGTLFVDSTNHYVGVGTNASLQTALHVLGEITIQNVAAQNSFLTNSGYPKLYDGSAGGSYPFSTNGNLVIQPRSTSSSYDIVLATGGTTPSSRLVVKGSGKVGIGTTSPAELLDVSTSGYIKGKLKATNGTAGVTGDWSCEKDGAAGGWKFRFLNGVCYSIATA